MPKLSAEAVVNKLIEYASEAPRPGSPDDPWRAKGALKKMHFTAKDFTGTRGDKPAEPEEKEDKEDEKKEPEKPSRFQWKPTESVAAQIIRGLLEDGAEVPITTLNPIEAAEGEAFGVYAGEQWLGAIGCYDRELMAARYPQKPGGADWYAQPRKGQPREGFATREDAQRYVEQVSGMAMQPR